MKNSKSNISAVVIAKNEEEKIARCLRSIDWAGEVILVDTGSTDKTKDIAKQLKAKIIDFDKGNYSAWRNAGAKAAEGKWLLYVDADETVTNKLKEEINDVIDSDDKNAYAIPRKNIILEKEMKYGGWWPDYVVRLIKRKDLIKWQGRLHEQPKVKGDLGYLKSPLIHHKHDNLFEMLEKTNKWSEIEAGLLLKDGHPKMSWWRFFRVMLTELWLRLVKLQGYKDGTKGVIYSFYQMWSKFITYAKLWEMQNESSNS